MTTFDKLKNLFETKSRGFDDKVNNIYKEFYFDVNSKTKNDDIGDNKGYFSFANSGYIKNPVAFRAVNIITHTAGAIKLFIVENREGRSFNVHEHPLKSLITRPNPFMTIVDFIETIIYNFLIGGNAFVLMVRNALGSVKELYVLNPNDMTIITDQTNSFVTGYNYSNGDKTKEYRINQLTGECDILHLKNFHPTNNIYGLSYFEAAANIIDQHNSAIQWNKNLMKNSACPSGALVYNPDKKSTLTTAQRNELRKELDRSYSSADNSGRVLILEAGFDWKEMSKTPKDMDFSEADKIAVQHIANVFGVPVQLLNSTESSSYNNYIEAKRALYENTVLPLLNKIILSIFNNWICPNFGKDFSVIYKEEEIPSLSYKYEQQLKNLHESDFLTINEKRKILGFDPIPGGDTLMNVNKN